MPRPLLITLLAIAALAAIAVYYLLDPATTPFPRCPFRTLTGLLCPGCGSQRALHDILHLDIPAAFHHNALLVLSIPLVTLQLIAALLRSSHPRFYRALNNRHLALSIAIILILWAILRNILHL